METSSFRTAAITPWQASALAECRQETAAVRWLLSTEQIPRDAFSNAISPATGQPADVHEWVFFPRFSEADCDAVETAGIPIVCSAAGTWIGSDGPLPFAENGFLAAVADALLG